MSVPCLCRGIIAEAQVEVKSRIEHASIVPAHACPEPAASGIREEEPHDLQCSAQEPLSWREVTDFRERLRLLPASRALDVLSMLSRWVDAQPSAGRDQ